METEEKIALLGSAGKWDVCASSASARIVSGNDRIGNLAASGICHSFTENGRCVSLFKTLLTNSCSYDCKYCQNSVHCNKKRTSYEPEELAKVFMHLYLTNHVEGLFLSSGIVKDADHTTERMLESVRLLRDKYKFQGYVHFKILPGTSLDLVKQASQISDRLSINLEAPNKSRMSQISDLKDYKSDILKRQAWISRLRLCAGQTTQLVVGGSDETDLEIMRMANWEYEHLELSRVYYSAFTPIEKTPLERKTKIPLEREHQLYSADFMMRKYGIKFDEIKTILADGNFPKGDPKVHMARMAFDRPVDINEATYDELVRIPGIGPQSARRIMSIRESQKIMKREQLHNIGVVLKRAEPFIDIAGSVQKTVFDYA